MVIPTVKVVPGVKLLVNVGTPQLSLAEGGAQLTIASHAALDATIEERKAAIDYEDLVTLIYTSGTTGNPKGVMLAHKNLLSNVKDCEPRLPVDSNAKSLSFLPVCHVYERMLLYLYQYTGVSVYFAESMDTIGDDLREVKPNVFTAVPRLLEKVYDKIMAKGEALTGIKRKLFLAIYILIIKKDENEKFNFSYFTTSTSVCSSRYS